MTKDTWPTKRLPIASLHLDDRNPRLGREAIARAPREIIQFHFQHDKALEVARSIAAHGYFPNEPLLAIKEDGRLVVVEGNRRLAALKALREPSLLTGLHQRQVDRIARQIENPDTLTHVPVTIAPSRRATDRQLAGRHIGTPVLPWEAENQASFILAKLADGYTNDELRSQLRFSSADIRAARQRLAINDMVRSLDLPDDVQTRLSNPRAKIYSTVERVFDFSVGREQLGVVPDETHGFRGTRPKDEFTRVLTKLVVDIAKNNVSSRTLNSNDDMKRYFESWPRAERPSNKKGAFVPDDIIQDRPGTSLPAAPTPRTRTKQLSKTVLPRDFRVNFGNARLKAIRTELVKLKRDDFANAGTVMMRVFLELAVTDYLTRSGQLKVIIKKLKDSGVQLRHGMPTMKQLVPEIIRIAKDNLPKADARNVEKALTYHPSAPFTLTELHSFVHSSDMPTASNILQFWNRTEPLFRLMLERDQGDGH